MKRGDIVIAVLPGDYGKPRPTVVVQDDRLQRLDSVIVCPLTSDVMGAGLLRITLDPSPANGLKKRSEVMVEKLMAIDRSRCREVAGRLDAATMAEIDGRLRLVLGLV